MESLAAEVTTVQEEEVCRGERESRGGCLVVVVVSCGGAGGGEARWWLEWRRERGKEKLQKRGWGAGFWPTFDPIFSSLRPLNPPIFIGGRRGQSRLHKGKISALDSVWKDLNCWLKVGMVHS